MKRPRTVCLIGLAVTCLVACGAAWAVDGRDFPAFFQPTDATESAGEVSMTFSADLYNYFGEDLSGATVELRGLFYPDDVFTTFLAVDIFDGDAVRLTAAVTVPLDEYQGWEQGGSPTLTIDFQDAAGASHSRTAEIAFFPLGEEAP